MMTVNWRQIAEQRQDEIEELIRQKATIFKQLEDTRKTGGVR